MPAMARETWTDERLDDLSRQVSDGFREQREETRALGRELRAEIKGVDESLRAEVKGVEEGLRAEIKGVEEGLRAEIKAGDDALAAEIQALRAEMQAGFTHIHERIDRLQVMIIGTLLTLAIALVLERL